VNVHLQMMNIHRYICTEAMVCVNATTVINQSPITNDEPMYVLKLCRMTKLIV
jgi:hypothetical protein